MFLICWLHLQHESRNGSTSKRGVISSSRPGSSAEPSENRSSRLFSSGSRHATTQRVPQSYESAAARPGHEDAIRSFELLTIGSGKKRK